MKRVIVSMICFAACAVYLKAQPVNPAPAKTMPMNGSQVSQVQDFSKRAAAIQKERTEMSRAWDAEFKIIQLEFQAWVETSCKELGSEGCSANVQSEDVSKWTWSVPEKKTNAAVAPPSKPPNTVAEKTAKDK